MAHIIANDDRTYLHSNASMGGKFMVTLISIPFLNFPVLMLFLLHRFFLQYSSHEMFTSVCVKAGLFIVFLSSLPNYCGVVQ